MKPVTPVYIEDIAKGWVTDNSGKNPFHNSGK